MTVFGESAPQKARRVKRCNWSEAVMDIRDANEQAKVLTRFV